MFFLFVFFLDEFDVCNSELGYLLGQNELMTHNVISLQGINVLKRNDDCFVLDEFDGVPDDIKDWEQFSDVVGTALPVSRVFF